MEQMCYSTVRCEKAESRRERCPSRKESKLNANLQAEEMIQEPYKPAAPPGKTAVKIRDGSFGWEKDGDALLKSINFEASSGQLIIVIGEVSLF